MIEAYLLRGEADFPGLLGDDEEGSDDEHQVEKKRCQEDMATSKCVKRRVYTSSLEELADNEHSDEDPRVEAEKRASETLRGVRGEEMSCMVRQGGSVPPV